MNVVLHLPAEELVEHVGYMTVMENGASNHIAIVSAVALVKTAQNVVDANRIGTVPKLRKYYEKY